MAIQSGGWAAPTCGPTRLHRNRSAVATPPAWLKTAHSEPAQPAAHFQERLRIPESARRETRMERGRFLHKLLQRLPELPEEARAATAALLAKREGFAEAIAASAVTLIADPRYSGFFASKGLAEVPMVMRGPDGRMIAGQIDRLLVTEDEVLILDYKTDTRARRQRRGRRPGLPRPTRGLPRGGQIGVSRAQNPRGAALDGDPKPHGTAGSPPRQGSHAGKPDLALAAEP